VETSRRLADRWPNFSNKTFGTVYATYFR